MIDSDDPRVWSRAISKVMEDAREKRITEVDKFRAMYEDTYSWKAQCTELIEKMISGTNFFVFRLTHVLS